MKKLLITGFEPFGGEKINPSFEAVKLLPEEISGVKLYKLEVPVEYKNGAEHILKKADEIKPDAIIMTGQAGGRDGVTPELVAINYMESRIADNAGIFGKREPIIPGGKEAYFSTLPVHGIAENINEAGIKAKLSLSAGAFVCNDVMYRVLSVVKVPAGFIHVPFMEGQGEPFMPLTDIAKALEIAAKTVISHNL